MRAHRAFLFLALAALTGSPAAVRADPPADKRAGAKDDKELLAGHWRIVAVDEDPTKPAGERSWPMELVTGWLFRERVVAGSAYFHLYVRTEGGIALLGGGPCTLDPSAPPKGIDLGVLIHRPSLLGIYKLDGDRLTVCYGEMRISGRTAYFERPREFTAKPGSGQTVVVLQREPGGAPGAAAPPGAKPVEGKPLAVVRGPTGRVESLAFSPDGKHLAAAVNGRVAGTPDYLPCDLRIRDATTGADVLRLRGPEGPVNEVAFSPDGRRLAAVCGCEQLLRVWDATTGGAVLTLRHPGALTAVAFSPDGRRIATAGSGVRVWDDASKELLSLKGPDGPAWWPAVSVAFSPDGRALAAATSRPPGTVKVWDTATGRELLTASGGYHVAFAQDGTLLAGSGADVSVWDVGSGRKLRSFPVRGRAFFRGDGQRLATVEFCSDILEETWSGKMWSEVQVWDTATGRPLVALGRRPPPGAGVAFSRDGTRLAFGSGDAYAQSEIEVWDTVAWAKNAR